MNIHHDDLAACVDCVLYIANGDIPNDRPELPRLLAERFPPDVHLVSGSDEEAWFSWRACDVCGQHLGGNDEGSELTATIHTTTDTVSRVRDILAR